MDLLTVSPEFWLQNEEDCLRLLNDESIWDSIPLLNASNLQDLSDKRLVRFYGMVQDMFNPEYYYEKYEVIDEVSMVKSLKSGRYLDIHKCKDSEVINYESDKNVTRERQTLVLITIPGLNGWVEEIEKKKYQKSSTLHQELLNNGNKRSIDSDALMDVQPPLDDSNKKQCVNNANQSNPQQEQQQAASVSREHLLNFPLPEPSSGKACHVKVYEENNDLCLNNIIEVVGFLSVDPSLTSVICNEEFDNEMEVQTHHPPPSLIPRIHCVKWKKLEHNNLLVNKNNKLSLEKMGDLRKELHLVLTQLFMGDCLAADYFICHLISKVYLRNEFLPLGKFTLNISNIPDRTISDYGKRLYEFIKILVPKSHYFPMTLENMNECTFAPKKDYECDRLTSGLLQLSNNTHLILDETKLTAGRVNESGIKAIATLSETIKCQKVTYDFNYFPMEFECDLPILILSEGMSLLPSDFYVILKPEEDQIATFNEICQAAKHFLKPELLNDLRIYLTLARHGKYELTNDVEELVQNEFVKMRQERKVTSHDLHQLLVLARLISLSEGKSALDTSCWRKACSLEEERKSRSRMN